MYILQAKNLRKTFRIYDKPIERIKHVFGLKSKFTDIHAVNDISLNVSKGEFVGIVGKNGSGKSTLLKLITKVLTPAEGSIEVNGTLSYLQLGLGFDPELSGYDNIVQGIFFQNLSLDESRISELVDFVEKFSELGQSLNFPVKTYSSGMYSRLAFSLAIAQEPDIIIADEVLAVGDMNFSQKCLTKMVEMKSKGVTIILVTHDIDAIKIYGDRAIWIDSGVIVEEGEPKFVCDNFRNKMLYDRPETKSINPVPSIPDKSKGNNWLIPNKKNKSIESSKIEILRYKFNIDESVSYGDDSETKAPNFYFEIEACSLEDFNWSSFGLIFHASNGIFIFHQSSEFYDNKIQFLKKGDTINCVLEFTLPPIRKGDYSITLGVNELYSDGSNVPVLKYDHDCMMTVSPHPKSHPYEAGLVYIIDGKYHEKVIK